MRNTEPFWSEIERQLEWADDPKVIALNKGTSPYDESVDPGDWAKSSQIQIQKPQAPGR